MPASSILSAPSARTINLNESVYTYRPGDRAMGAVVTELQMVRTTKRVNSAIARPPSPHREEVADIRRESQQAASPEGKPQQGDCSGPAVQIEVLTPSDLSGSYVQFVFGATQASEDYLVYS